MKRLIKCLLCGLRYDANEHKACPNCLKGGYHDHTE